MANTILHKRSSSSGATPTAGQLTAGELALNTADGKIFMKNSAGTVVEIGYRDARVDSRVQTLLGSVGYDIIPTTDNTYSLGSASKMWKDVFVGPGSLYINGQKVLQEDSGDIVVSCDINQNLTLQTSGSGDINLDPTGSGVIALKGPIQVQAGSNVASSDGNAINFSNQIAVDSLTSKSSNTDLTLTAAGTGKVYINDNAEVSGNFVIGGNLTVSGTTTTINAETISLADNLIDLNSNFTTGAPTENAGLRVIRGDEANTQIRWNESSDVWQITNDGSTYTNIVGHDATQTLTNKTFSLGSNTVTGTLAQFNTAVTDADFASLAGTETLTNKTIAAGSNTISGLTNANLSGTAGITNANLANSAVTIGSTSVSLGATATTLAGLTSVTSTGFTGALTGNADTATKWATARTITLGGDLSGSVSLDGSANVTLTATVASNTVALGTDTTGNYMVDVTAGSGISVTHTPGEGSTATVAIDSTVATLTGAQTLTNKTIALGSNTVSGTIAQFNTAVTDADLATLAGSETLTNKTLTAPNVSGLVITDGSITVEGATADAFETTLAFTDPTADRTITFPDLTGTVVTTGDTGSVTNTMLAGSIANAKLANSTISGKALGTNLDALTISTGLSGTSYNGSAGVTIAIDSTVATLTGSQTLTNKTLTAPTITSPTVTSLILGDASIIFEGATADAFETTLTVTDPTQDNTITLPNVTGTVVTTGDTGSVTNTMLAGSIANAKLTNSAVTIGSTSVSLGATATTLAGLTSVTSTGFTGALTGNASTATTLQTARTIQGVSFDGSANITVVTAGTGVSVSGTAVSIGQAVGTTSNVTFNDLTVSGNLTVNGTTTTINSTTLSVDDKNVVLGDVASPSDVTADGGGFTLKGATDKTFNWVDATDAWTSSEHIATAAGKNHIFNGATSGTITLTPTAVAGTTTLTLPATTGTLVTTGDTGTVTNAMLAGSIANAKLTNSSITVNGSAISLGGSATITANTTNALTIGTGLSGTSFNGSSGVTIAIDSTVATLTGSQTLTNKTLTAPAIGSGGFTIAGSTSGTVTIVGQATASGTLTLPNGADTLVGRATTDTLTNKTLTSPTLTTPVLGTPSSGTLTNCTGLPVSTGISGLGTGVATALAVNVGSAGAFVTFNGALGTPSSGTLTNATGLPVSTGISGLGTGVATWLATPSSANLASAVTDETGSGALTFATAPTFTTSIDGSATFGAFASSTTLTEGYTGTATSTHNIATGATANLATKTINLGTAGAAGSTTTITIGSTTGTSTTTVNQTFRATGEITAYYSDKRLKENIKPIENALAKTMALHGVTYNANEVAAEFGYTNKETQVGLLAQDVKAVLPEVVVPAPFDIKVVDGKEVSKSGEDYITIKYEKIVALLVEAIKELNDKVESLESQLGGSKTL